MDPKTPVVVTSWGTYPYQKTIEGNISDIANKIAKKKEITSPAVIVVGKVADLRKKINWYEKKALFGKKILVTRAAKQSSQIVEHLSDLGAQVIEFPTIEIAEPKSWTNVDRAIKNFNKYNFVVFTSVNGVKSFFTRVGLNNFDSRIFKDKTIIAIGEKTASELNNYGLNADLIPIDYTAEGILSIIDKRKIKNKRFLIPRAKIARDLLPKKLKEYGAFVDTVACYENVIPNIKKKDIKSIENLIKNEGLDFITFTSSSTVNNFFKIIDSRIKNINKIKIASIGPITDDTVQKNGFESKIVAKKYTVEGLIKALESYYS